MKNNQEKTKFSLSRKLLSVVLLTSSIVSIFSSALQFLLEYQEESKNLSLSLKSFEQTGLPSITKFSWNLDEKALDEVLSSSLAMRELASIAVYDSEHKILAHKEKPGMEAHTLSEQKFPMLSPERQSFGYLIVRYTRDFILEQIEIHALTIIGTNFLKSIVVSFILLVFFQRMLIRPMQQISQHFRSIDQSAINHRPPLLLKRKSRYLDEFDEVVEGINGSERHLREIFHKLETLVKDQDDLVQSRTQSLANKSDQLGAAIEAIPGYLLWCDKDFNLLGANQMWLKHQNRQYGQALPSEIFFFTQSNNQEFRQKAKTFLESSQDIYQYETIIENQTQSLRLLVCLSRLESSQGFMMVAIDTTQAWILEREAVSNREFAINNARLSSLGEMAGGIAHEINNPLAIIHGTSQLMKRLLNAEPPKIENALQALSKISLNCERIGKIILGMKVLSRKGEDDPMIDEDLNQVLAAALDISIGRCKESGIELRVLLPEEPLTIKCRRVQIGQVVVNLLNNGIDAIKEHESRWIEVSVRQEAAILTIMITDSGHGIPETLRQKILEPFFTTKPVGSGTGLGLSISLKIMEEHGGRLRYDTSCPHTRFCMEFPAVAHVIRAS